jgi:hypothetical protein
MRRPAGGPHAAVNRDDTPFPRVVGQARHLAAEGVALKFKDRLRENHGHARVKGVAAPGQHAQSGDVGEVVARTRTSERPQITGRVEFVANDQSL